MSDKTRLRRQAERDFLRHCLRTVGTYFYLCFDLILVIRRKNIKKKERSLLCVMGNKLGRNI